MEKLSDDLNLLLSKLPHADAVRGQVETLAFVYPFNQYEHIISHLLAEKIITLEDYYLFRDEYFARNLYLYLFEISAPRGFGETWAQGHLKELVPDLVKPTRKIDPQYSGQYDFLLPLEERRIRIEVKASRVVQFKTDAPLYLKALSWDSKQPFDMNFQQVKPACCDVFVWIGVWRDVIKYWVLSAQEVEANAFFSTGQHRGNTGEGQLHLNEKNIRSFEPFSIRPDKLRQALVEAFHRQTA